MAMRINKSLVQDEFERIKTVTIDLARSDSTYNDQVDQLTHSLSQKLALLNDLDPEKEVLELRSLCRSFNRQFEEFSWPSAVYKEVKDSIDRLLSMLM